MLMVMMEVSLSLLMCVLDLDGSKALCFVWWKLQAVSHIRHPWHLSGESIINGFRIKRKLTGLKPVGMLDFREFSFLMISKLIKFYRYFGGRNAVLLMQWNVKIF
jgi:hypothetical protein